MSGKPTVATVQPKCFKAGNSERFSLRGSVCGTATERDDLPVLLHASLIFVCATFSFADIFEYPRMTVQKPLKWRKVFIRQA
jgi:hypothetical protein